MLLMLLVVDIYDARLDLVRIGLLAIDAPV